MTRRIIAAILITLGLAAGSAAAAGAATATAAPAAPSSWYHA